MVSSFGLGWQQSFGIIVVLYFYSHYLFASGAAHIGAMYTAFLSVAIACGTPGLLAAIALGQVTLMGHPASERVVLISSIIWDRRVGDALFHRILKMHQQILEPACCAYISAMGRNASIFIQYR